MSHCLTREDKMEENSWLDITMRDEEYRESHKKMGKQQTERQTACCRCNNQYKSIERKTERWGNVSGRKRTKIESLIDFWVGNGGLVLFVGLDIDVVETYLTTLS